MPVGGDLISPMAVEDDVKPRLADRSVQHPHLRWGMGEGRLSLRPEELRKLF
jgi:hypothetical protein